MLDFLAQKNIEESHRREIVDEIFKKCDMDRNGFIELEEFVQHYYDTSRKLEERQKEQYMKIMSLKKLTNAIKL